jgi:hypothetical protein
VQTLTNRNRDRVVINRDGKLLILEDISLRKASRVGRITHFESACAA